MRWLRSLTRITYLSKLIGTPSLAAFLQLELFGVYDGIKELMQVAYACAMRIFYYVEKHYEYKLTTDEIMFLTIHINRLSHHPK